MPKRNREGGAHMVLYHGSERIIEKPQFGAGRKNNDFGLGFYCTESEEMAKEWGCSSLSDGYANQYLLDTEGLYILNLNSEDYTILHWISVLISHRLFRVRTPIAGRGLRFLQEHYPVQVNMYDAIIGYRADDSYFDYADAFLNNGITVEQLATAMRLGKLGEQFVLKSRPAFDRIQFLGCTPAPREIWFPKKDQRTREAQSGYEKMLQSATDGLYLADIIRQEVKNDDPRIPRALS